MKNFHWGQALPPRSNGIVQATALSIEIAHVGSKSNWPTTPKYIVLSGGGGGEHDATDGEGNNSLSL
jgi:hypothetical protein